MTGDSEEKKGHTPGPWKLGSRVGEKNCFVEIWTADEIVGWSTDHDDIEEAAMLFLLAVSQ